MDLRQLTYLVRTVDSASISQAARALNIAQPSLSQRLKDLEEELGLRLIDRTPSGIRPTEAGARIADRARAILRLVEALVIEARSDTHAPAGDVFVGLPTTMALHLTVPLVKAVRERFPKVNLRISEGMSGHIQEWLLSGRLDLAILYTDEPAGGLILDKLTDEDLCLISRPDASHAGKTIRFADLGAIPLVLPGPDHGLRRSIEKVRANTGAALSIAVEVDSLPHMKRLAADGALSTILPAAACREEIQAGQLFATPIVRPNLRRPIVLARTNNRPGSAAVERINDLLRQLVLQSLAAG